MTADDIWNGVQRGLLLLVTAGVLPIVIRFFLGKRNANKKLDLEERTVEVTEFTAQTKAYAELAQMSQRAAKAAEDAAAIARGEAQKAATEREHMRADMVRVVDKFRQLRDLFKSYVARVGIPLTADEQKIFEDTQDVVRRKRRR